jgi:hypothetical protein
MTAEERLAIEEAADKALKARSLPGVPDLETLLNKALSEGKVVRFVDR